MVSICSYMKTNNFFYFNSTNATFSFFTGEGEQKEQIQDVEDQDVS